jgi:23S rRNA pseudouridine1911/1915/1917 synthase
MIVTSKVPSNAGARNIVEYLAARFTYLPADAWRSRIEEGLIQCNQQVCSPVLQVNAGDTISYAMPELVEPPADLNYAIIHEDQWLLGINKPGNLPVHRSGKSFTSNLIYQLRYTHLPPYPEAQIVNRLDRETSGVVLVARDAFACKRLHEEFSERRVSKRYYAVVEGIPAPGNQTIDLPIGKKSGSAVWYRFCVGGDNPRDALTHFEVVRPIGTRHALLSVTPVTGRTHQIRVHLQAIGHCIVGDKLYSMSDEEFIAWRAHPDQFRDRFPIDRQALHCASMTFQHPYIDSRCTLAAPIPVDIETLMDRLEKI